MATVLTEKGIIPQFEDLDKLRKELKKNNDPNLQLEFVGLLLESSSQLHENLNLPSGVSRAEHLANEERKSMLRRTFETEALRWLKKLAGSSNGIGMQPIADAQFMLAEYYGKGLFSLPVDHGKAFNLYVQASKQNHPVATYRAAVCYEVGAGTKKDHGRSLQFYRKAAALGDDLAMHKLALILLYGKMGQRKNLKEGITWLKRAANVADEKHPEALHDLAQCYERRGGCPVVIPDEQYAFELYAEAAKYGFAPSQYRLGTCYEFGLLGCSIDPASSIKFYAKAAEQGFPDAELALSSWYLSGSEGILPQSDHNAFLWAQRAADRNYVKAQFQLGTYHEVGVGVPADPDIAMKWYAKAAAKGHEKAAQRLAELKKANRRRTKCIIA